jgi:ABC-2 type transport system permease protein
MRAMALNSISSDLQLLTASMILMLRDRWFVLGRSGYILVWIAQPLFNLAFAALIHASGRTELVAYVVVAMTAHSFIFTAIFWVGELLDRERLRGTLPNLFLSPRARLAWLGGFALAGAAETIILGAVAVLAGIFLFGVTFNIAPFSLVVIGLLFLIILSGLGFVFTALGLLVRNANALSNLVSPLVLLFGGIYFPVADLPLALRVIARLLPIGYATEALALSTLHATPISEMTSQLVPLIGFAVLTPVLGYLAVAAVDRLIRHSGTVDLY